MATKKKTSRPSVPRAQSVPALTAPSEAAAPKYEPMSVADFEKFMRSAYDIQLGYAPQLTEAQRYAQDVLYRNMSALQREQAAPHMAFAHAYNEAYDPQFRAKYQQQAADLGTLGTNVSRELAAGYELGPNLGREVEQAVRGAQTARGNILGAAPTAQEAFGKGQAALNLYQQRLGNYNQYLGQQQNFLQGRNPLDMMSQTAGTFLGANYYPSQSYVDPSLGANAAVASGTQGQAYNATVMSGYSSFQGALQNYNQNQISGTTATNEGIFNTYDRAAESWMYDEAVRRGLYSQPQVGGGGGSSVMQGVTTGVTAAAGVATAASAAGAAICWLARRCLPHRWEQFQRYLFTDAPEKLRKFYLYNARRLAREISDDEAIEIGGLMNDCLNLRSLA